MITLELIPGTKVKYKGNGFVITRICDVNSVIIENPQGDVDKVPINMLEHSDEINQDEKEVSTILDKDWAIAQKRFSIIHPVLKSANQREKIKEIAKINDIGESTIYRWVNIYNKTRLVSSLVPAERTGGKGQSRLDPKLDAVIKKAIKDHYLNNNRKSVQRVCIEVMLECKKSNLEPPHYNTLRHRIAMISDYDTVRYRLGKKEAKKRFEPKINPFPDAQFPLSSVQIDHTPLDIIVVDSEQRKPIGRPWITLAIDTFSRMVVGLNITFEHPSAMSVGLCMAHAILPKEEWLAQRDVFSEWPCWGVMKTVHIDNGKDFRSNMLKKACLEYNVEIDYRPAGTPEYGGIIERMLGTLGTEIHALDGTTFSRFEQRGEYDSEAKATFTLKELEQWLVHLIVEVYHNRFHETIKKTPIAKWKDGLLGEGDILGVGLPPRILNTRKVYLDFMPFEERTIQDYGVMIDNVCYYSDIFKRWINAVDPKSGKLKAKRKFIFKRDPRDISIVFFLDPDLKEYFPVPYRDTSKPSISIWEFRAARDRVIQAGHSTVDEEAIFRAYNRMKEIEAKSAQTTKRAKRLSAIKDRQVEHRANILNSQPANDKMNRLIEDHFTEETIEAFEDIDDGASY
jgi:putative transposase